MPFVEAKCTNCGGPLSVDNVKHIWICNYCNTHFIFEKLTKDYDNANNLNFFGVRESDFIVRDKLLEKDIGESRKIVIPNSVTNMSSDFENFTSIESVTIPNSVKNMKYAFCGYTSLKSVDIQYGITDISHAFKGCTSLKYVTIPDSVKKMEYAFYGCTSLKSVTIPDSVTNIWGAFKSCTSLKSIKIPRSINYIWNSDFEGCYNLTDIDYPYLSKFADCFPAIKEHKRKGLCIYCGGTFSFFGKCKLCGKKKNY